MNGQLEKTAASLLLVLSNSSNVDNVSASATKELLALAGDSLPRVSVPDLGASVSVNDVLKAKAQRAASLAYLCTDTAVLDELVRRERRKVVRAELMCNKNLSRSSAELLAAEAGLTVPSEAKDNLSRCIADPNTCLELWGKSNIMDGLWETFPQDYPISEELLRGCLQSPAGMEWLTGRFNASEDSQLLERFLAWLTPEHYLQEAHLVGALNDTDGLGPQYVAPLMGHFSSLTLSGLVGRLFPFTDQAVQTLIDTLRSFADSPWGADEKTDQHRNWCAVQLAASTATQYHAEVLEVAGTEPVCVELLLSADREVAVNAIRRLHSLGDLQDHSRERARNFLRDRQVHGIVAAALIGLCDSMTSFGSWDISEADAQEIFAEFDLIVGGRKPMELIIRAIHSQLDESQNEELLVRLLNTEHSDRYCVAELLTLYRVSDSVLMSALNSHPWLIPAWSKSEFANDPTVEVADKLLDSAVAKRSNPDVYLPVLQAGAILTDYSVGNLRALPWEANRHKFHEEITQLLTANTQQRGTRQQLHELLLRGGNATFTEWIQSDGRTRAEVVAFARFLNEYHNRDGEYYHLRELATSTLLSGEDLELLDAGSASVCRLLAERDDLPARLAIKVASGYDPELHRWFNSGLPCLELTVENFEAVIEFQKESGFNRSIWGAIHNAPDSFDVTSTIRSSAGFPAETVQALAAGREVGPRVIAELLAVVEAAGSAQVALSMAQDWTGSFEELQAVLGNLNNHRERSFSS